MDTLHDKLLQWIKEENLPEPSIPPEEKIWIPEYEIGRKIAQMGSTQDDKHYNYWHIYKRIDCVCIVQEHRIWILEFKQKLNFEAIGQVLVYKAIFEMEEPEYEEINMGIVSNEGHPLCEIACINLGLGITFYKRNPIDSWDGFIQKVLEWKEWKEEIENMVRRYKERY